MATFAAKRRKLHIRYDAHFKDQLAVLCLKRHLTPRERSFAQAGFTIKRFLDGADYAMEHENSFIADEKLRSAELALDKLDRTLALRQEGSERILASG